MHPAPVAVAAPSSRRQRIGVEAPPRRAPPVAGAYRSDPGDGSPSAKTSAMTQQPLRAMPKAIPIRV